MYILGYLSCYILLFTLKYYGSILLPTVRITCCSRSIRQVSVQCLTCDVFIVSDIVAIIFFIIIITFTVITNI